jgi:hypothetical protein
MLDKRPTTPGASASSTGKPPDQLVAESRRARRKLARAKPEKPEGRAGPDDIARAYLIAEAAKEVSQPDRGALG